MSEEKDHDAKYTEPALRRKIKDELMKSSKGGKPGEWSARKSQMLVREYERRGGGYKGEKSEAARSLEEWTEQDWKTESGEPAKHGGATSRYLPKKVWDELTDGEKEQADRKKRAASRRGEQYVEYTPAVRRAMREAGVLKGAAGRKTADKKTTAKKTSTKKVASKKAAAKKK